MAVPRSNDLLERFRNDESIADIGEDAFQRIIEWIRKQPNEVILPSDPSLQTNNPLPQNSSVQRNNPTNQPAPPLYTQAQQQQINDWCKITTLLLNLIRQSPDCPVALLRLVHFKGVEKATFINEAGFEHFLLSSSIAEGTDEQLCGLLNAMMTPKYKPTDFGLAWMVALSLRIRTFDVRKRGLQLNSSRAETELVANIVTGLNQNSVTLLDGKLREKSSRPLITLVNRALQCVYAVTPYDFFAVPLLAYMGFDRKTLTNLSEGAMTVFMDLFTKPIKSVGEILPGVLAEKLVWRSLYVPILDSIIFSLIPLLRDMHNLASFRTFDALPIKLKELLPQPTGGQMFSPILQLPLLTFYGRFSTSSVTLQRFEMPTDELMDDRYITLHNKQGRSASDSQFNGEIRLRNGKSKLNLRWHEKRIHNWENIVHARGYHHLSVLFKIFNNIVKRNAMDEFLHTTGEMITQEDLDEAEYDIRLIQTRLLCVAEAEGEVAYGCDYVPIPSIRFWPIDRGAWGDVNPRYQACFRFFSPNVEPTDDDERRIEQAIKLLHDNTASLLMEDDRHRLLRSEFEVAVNYFKVHPGELDGTAKFYDLWHLQNPPDDRLDDEEDPDET